MSTENPHSEIDAFRHAASRLGLDDGIDVEIEPVDAFLTRMKARSNVQAPSRRRWGYVALVATAAATVAIAVVVLRPAGTPAVAATPPVLDFEYAAAVRIAHAPGEDPQKELEVVAAAASQSEAAQAVGAAQYHLQDSWYSEVDEDGGSVITPRVSETWLSPDGRRIIRDTKGPSLRADGRGVATNAPSLEPLSSSEDPAGSIDAGRAAALPTEPADLRAALLDHIDCPDREPGPARSLCLYSELLDLFQTYVVPPKVASAAWLMLGDEADFTSLGSVEDRAGRQGLGISLIPASRPHYRFILIISTESGQLLGSEEILIKDQADIKVEAPAVTSFNAIVTSKWSDLP